MKRGMILTGGLTFNPLDGGVAFRGLFNQQLLRYGLLYLDNIQVVQSELFVTGMMSDMAELAKAGVINEVTLKLPAHGLMSPMAAAEKTYLPYFDELNRRPNEIWMLNKEFRLMVQESREFSIGGESISFLNALPIPAEDFPLGDLYEFREKRNDERVELLNSIDRLRIKVEQADDKRAALQNALLDVEQNLINVTRLLKESKRGFYMSDLSLDYSSQTMLSTFNDTFGNAVEAGLPTHNAFLAGIGAALISTFKISGGYRYKKSKPNSPYLYAAEVKQKFNI